MKNIKIRLKKLENLEFEILEDANKHDIFQLKDAFDESANSYANLKQQLSNVIEKEAELKFKNKIEEKKQNIIKEFINNDNNIHAQLKRDNISKQQQIINLNNAIKHQKEMFRLEKENFENKFINSDTNVYAQLKRDNISKQQQIINLNNAIKHQKEIFDLEKQNFESKFMSDENSSFGKLKKECANKHNQIEFLKKEKQMQDEKYEDLRNRKISSQTLGAELENWIDNKFHENFGPLLESDAKYKIKWNSQQSVKVKDYPNYRADFTFSILNEQNSTPLCSVIIEAKNSLKGAETNKNKNKDHFDKLAKSQRAMNANYSLLITELEPQKSFQIIQVPDKDNMYMVRPQFFSSFLSIVYNLTVKHADIINANISFRKRNEVLDEFNEMKDKIFLSIEHLNRKIEKIQSENRKISTASDKLDELINEIITHNIKMIKSKIDKFKIHKVTDALASK